MRELTTREKIGIVIIGVAAIVALFYFDILSPSRLGLTGGELGKKKAELSKTKDLVKFNELVSDIEDNIVSEAGLQGNLILEPLFQNIKDKLTLEKLNQAKIPKDLYDVVPELKNRAQAILDYRKKIGKFENIEQLKEIKCSIFDMEPAQAVLASRISELTQKVGINPKYQLSIKPLGRSKKREIITTQNRSKLIEKLYRHELQEELNSLKEQLNNEQQEEQNGEPIEEQNEEVLSENSPEQQDAKDIQEPSVDEQSNDSDNEENEDQGDLVDNEGLNEQETDQSDNSVESTQAQENQVDSEKEQLEEVQSVEDKVNKEDKAAQFLSLPKIIPIETRIEMAEAILDSPYTIKEQMNSNTRLKNIFEEFETSEHEKPLQIKSLMLSYFKQVTKEQKELLDWLRGAPTSYTKNEYVVEILSVKGKLEQLVKLIHSIESSSSFLRVRDFQITIADKKETILNANIEMVAMVL